MADMEEIEEENERERLQQSDNVKNKKKIKSLQK